MESTNMDVMLDPRRNQAADRKKLYEEMLLKELPGTNRTNEPMHAVLEGELGESEKVEGREAQNVRNHALIHYLATLANSNSTKDKFDFDFVESLLQNGADINSTDKTGQTIFHEIARSWNVDVAKFLITKGANVNQQDQYGRSPLHVAAAVDYAEMVEFLLQNGADIDIKTSGEEQTAIHFAAKNDAVNSLQMLLGYGADIDARDSKNRTPIQVAAEMNRSKAAKLLISEGAPAGVYDNLGNSALCLLIEKIPEVALKAMDQFHSVDTINRKELYFLNYLEGTKLKEKKTPARTPLEIAVQNERFDIIMHPVMQRLIAVKWKMYGKWGAVMDLVLNLVYTILWTVLAVTLPLYGRDLYLPIERKSWRLVIGILLVVFTVWEIRKQIIDTIKTRRSLKKWKEWRAAELERDIAYCHPRWPQETQYLQSEIKAVRHLSHISGADWWIYFDWVALVFILATIASHVTFFHYSTNLSKDVHHYIIMVLLLILWLRILKYARPFESAGPFVVIFGHVLGDIVKWAFLNSIIVIPFTCAFWITFGAISLTPVQGYDNVGPLLYNIFSMMVVNDHNYEVLEAANPVMARLLCGAFIGIAAIVTLNLLIALLSNTFERLYENAVANAVMQRARTILLLQKSLRKKQKKKYYGFIKKKGSPEVIRNGLGRLLSTDGDDNASLEQIHEDVGFVMKILGERFGKKYGKGKKSDMDFVKMDLSKVRRFQEELVVDVRNMKLMIEGITATVEILSSKTSENKDDGENSKESQGNNSTGSNSNQNNNVSTSNAATVKKVPVPFKMVVHKEVQRLTKKTEESEESSDDSSSETTSISNSSQAYSEKNNRKSKSKRKRDKKRGSHKKKREMESDDDKQDKKAQRLPYPGSEVTNSLQHFTLNNDLYAPNERLSTSASYPDFRAVNDQIPLISQGYHVTSPYLSTNRRVFNPTVDIHSPPHNSLQLGHETRFSAQNPQRGNGFTNYGFQSEVQVPNSHPMTETDLQYYPNTSPTLHVPNITSIPRSQSDSRIFDLQQSIQHNDHPDMYQQHLSNMTNFQPHNISHKQELPHPSSSMQVNLMNSPGLSGMNPDFTFENPQINVSRNAQSYVTTPPQAFYDGPDNVSSI